MTTDMLQWADRLNRLPIAPPKRRAPVSSNRVLIYCPLMPKTPKVMGRTITSILRMAWDYPCEVVFGREDEPATSKYANLTAKYNWARQMALDGGYKALLTVEADMIVPVDALSKLIAVDADVAYGLYVSRHGSHKWLAFKYIDALVGDSYSQDPEAARSHWGAVVETQGVGLGCTLIHRRVLETLPFRADSADKVACDWLFSVDCQGRGYRQAHHFGVVCGHIASDDNCIYWPDPKAERLFHVEFLAEPAMQTLKPGEKVEIPINGMGSKYVMGRIEHSKTHKMPPSPQQANSSYWQVPEGLKKCDAS